MESEQALSAIEKQSRISSFLEIAVGSSAETAMQFLQATGWNLDEAILLFNEVDATSDSPPAENANSKLDQNLVSGVQDSGYKVRVPFHAVKDLFYNDASTIDTSQDILASLYRRPFHLIFNGSFEKAKDAAFAQDKWLIVNLQSTKEFSSLMLNRDTWANEAISQIIGVNFIFWQVYDDTSEGRKVCSLYNLDSLPVMLFIDPITGRKMDSRCGMIEPRPLGEILLSFMDCGPRKHATIISERQRALSTTPQQEIKASMETIKDTIRVSPSDTDVTSTDKGATFTTLETAYPPLPEESNVDGKSFVG